MLYSMTGFGRATAEEDGRKLTVELKSVNHRYLDLSFRMSKHIAFVEDALRAYIGSQISRGHLEVTVSYRNYRNDARIVTVDTALLAAYLCSARAACSELDISDDLALSSALRLPDVTTITEEDEDREAVTRLALIAIENAICELKSMRKAEGARLSDSLEHCIKNVEQIEKVIEDRSPAVVEEYREKLQDRIAMLLGDVKLDEARLAVEVAIFADKASIHEEIDRIKSHIKEFYGMLLSSVPVGRRLDFLVQELNREFNTIGSKANDSGIAANVIMAKAEIEKLREQIQNIE
ncbi:MAG: YicC/YloC family endoribonuclease [Candidatus Gastranaerophilaceae bacterium]|jgi:uncharacterized protein (TIGR00255 family)|nr:YicC/YloC family endoribonuclease [Christensenellales bacterium]